MYETDYKIDRDLSEAQAMSAALVPYVYEDTLYSTISGGLFGSRLPALTIGSLLLRLRRLRELQSELTDQQRSQLNQIEAQHGEVMREWRIHYEKKLQTEAASRLRAMKPFFDECKENPRLCAGAYLPEAYRRTIVQEIFMQMAKMGLEPDTEMVNLRVMADDGLRRFIRPSEFIWDVILKPVYDEKRFWWLYGHPPKNEK